MPQNRRKRPENAKKRHKRSKNSVKTPISARKPVI
jgi:hypothetical protein